MHQLLEIIMAMVLWKNPISSSHAWTNLSLRRCPLSRLHVSSLSKNEDDIAFRKRKAQEKRKQFIGLAKAVDRGQYAVTYQPGGADGRSFSARSGLPPTNEFIVLGVESSCDDTGAAVVSSSGRILGEALASQNDIHEVWGGVVPALARDAHEQAIDVIIQLALERAGLSSVDEVDAVGVTVGPGLEICLRVGCTAARQLAMQYNKPFVGIHHLEAHILMARLGSNLDFPFLALLVSGGHCQLMKCVGVGNYTILGGTLDDSLGEAFDKTARLLGLPVGGGGGPAIEELAKLGNATAIDLPVPLQRRKDLDFSYAGLKTAVRLAAERIRDERGLDSMDKLHEQDKANIAASFQNVAIRHVEQRLKYAMNKMGREGVQTLALVGGVAANQELRDRLEVVCHKANWQLHVPPPRLCTDQGAMSAWAAVERLNVGSSDEPQSQEVYARYPFAISDAS